MPSRFADIFDTVAIPVLSDQHGESVSWYALSNTTATPVPVTGIFVELEASDDTHRGKENLRKAELTILDGTIADARDFFVVNSESWQVRSVRRGTDGLIVCDLERRDMEVRNGGGGRLL